MRRGRGGGGAGGGSGGGGGGGGWEEQRARRLRDAEAEGEDERERRGRHGGCEAAAAASGGGRRERIASSASSGRSSSTVPGPAAAKLPMAAAGSGKTVPCTMRRLLVSRDLGELGMGGAWGESGAEGIPSRTREDGFGRGSRGCARRFASLIDNVVRGLREKSYILRDIYYLDMRS
jgi:hypothetical protein